MMPQQVFFVERLPYLRGSLTGGSTVVYAVCKGGWGTGCVGRVGPVKDSLTYRPSSQGWAPGVVLLYHFLYGVHLYCGLGWGFSILSRIISNS